MIVDLFAGPGGWDEGLRMLGHTGHVVGVEGAKGACSTAKAAGHARIRADVAKLPTAMFAGATGLIASPPCQAWSMAGKRGGESDRANCHKLADRMAAGDDATAWATWEADRSPLVCQPVRYVRDLRPEWVALEEVPAVASLWEHFARIFRVWGYSVWTGDLNAADYGVPQTRTRRILIASLSRCVTAPEATHAEHESGMDLFGCSSRPRWVSMAQALGWGATDLIGFPRRADTPSNNSTDAVVIGGVEYRARDLRDARKPAFVLTEKTRSWSRFSASSAPARVTVEEAAALQSFPPGYPWRGSNSKRYLQVGNAVPPLLAAHVLAEAMGVPAALEAAA